MLVYIILHTPSRYISTKSKRENFAKTKNLMGFNEQVKEDSQSKAEQMN